MYVVSTAFCTLLMQLLWCGLLTHREKQVEHTIRDAVKQVRRETESRASASGSGFAAVTYDSYSLPRSSISSSYPLTGKCSRIPV